MTGIKHTKTSQRIHTIDIHRTAPTDTLATAPSEGQCRVDLVLDPDQSIQHHGSGLVQIQGVALHPRLGGWLVGVPSVDVECLDLCVGIFGWLLDG